MAVISINSNIASLSAQQRLAKSNDILSRSYERLASGLRINRASDDAAGLAVASSLNVASRVTGQAIRNINDGVSVLNIADSAFGNLSNILGRQMELATQAANGTYSSAQRSALNREMQQLNEEYNRIIQSTSFNGMNLLDTSTTQLNIQAGNGIESVYQLNMFDFEEVSQAIGEYEFGYSEVQGDYVASADFNGDGRDDVVSFSLTDAGVDGQLHIWIYLSDFNGELHEDDEFQIAVNPGVEECSQFSIIDLGIGFGYIDVSGSYDIEYNVQYEYNGSASGWTEADFTGSLINNGSGEFTASSGFSFLTLDWTPTSIVYADFNGDGVEDYADNTGNVGIQTFEVVQSTVPVSLLQNLIDISSIDNARSGIDILQAALDDLNQRRGEYGAMTSRLESGLSNLSSRRQALDEASSRITDVDVATETSNLIRAQILQQVGASVLSSANLNPQLALQLLQNTLL